MHTFIHSFIHICIHMCTRTNVYMHAHAIARTHTHTHAHARMHVHTHAHTLMHTYMQRVISHPILNAKQRFVLVQCLWSHRLCTWCVLFTPTSYMQRQPMLSLSMRLLVVEGGGAISVTAMMMLFIVKRTEFYVHMFRIWADWGGWRRGGVKKGY